MVAVQPGQRCTASLLAACRAQAGRHHPGSAMLVQHPPSRAPACMSCTREKLPVSYQFHTRAHHTAARAPARSSASGARFSASPARVSQPQAPAQMSPAGAAATEAGHTGPADPRILPTKACARVCACRSARRSGRHASTGAGLKPAALKALVHMNVEKTVERLTQVRVTLALEHVHAVVPGSDTARGSAGMTRKLLYWPHCPVYSPALLA